VLQPLHLVGRRVPVRRLGERFGPRAQRFLLGQILGPDLLARRQIFATAREERAGRHAEPLHQIATGVARDRTGRLPGLLQLLESRGRPGPVRGRRQRLGFGHQGLLGREVGGALLAHLLEVRLAAGTDEIRRRAEAIPETLRHIARRFSDFSPAGVQLFQRTSRRRQIGFLLLLRLGLERQDDGLGHGDELFLALRVRKPAPIVHFAKLAHARRHLFLQRTERGHRVLDFLDVVEPAGQIQAAADILHQPIAFFQRDRVGL
jgi:hypothetical protein